MFSDFTPNLFDSKHTLIVQNMTKYDLQKVSKTLKPFYSKQTSMTECFNCVIFCYRNGQKHPPIKFNHFVPLMAVLTHISQLLSNRDCSV